MAFSAKKENFGKQDCIILTKNRMLCNTQRGKVWIFVTVCISYVYIKNFVGFKIQSCELLTLLCILCRDYLDHYKRITNISLKMKLFFYRDSLWKATKITEVRSKLVHTALAITKQNSRWRNSTEIDAFDRTSYVEFASHRWRWINDWD